MPIANAIHGSGPPLVVDSCWLSHLQYDWVSPVWRHYLVEWGRTPSSASTNAGIDCPTVASMTTVPKWVSPNGPLAARGLDNDEIATELALSTPTVERPLSNVSAKLDLHGKSARTAAVARLLTSG